MRISAKWCVGFTNVPFFKVLIISLAEYDPFSAVLNRLLYVNEQHGSNPKLEKYLVNPISLLKII